MRSANDKHIALAGLTRGFTGRWLMDSQPIPLYNARNLRLQDAYNGNIYIRNRYLIDKLSIGWSEWSCGCIIEVLHRTWNHNFIRFLVTSRVQSLNPNSMSKQHETSALYKIYLKIIHMFHGPCASKEMTNSTCIHAISSSHSNLNCLVHLGPEV